MVYGETPVTGLAYQIGYEDGAASVRESGTDEEPADGWDGWLINALNSRELVALFGLPEGTAEDGPAMQAALAEYAQGCRDGAQAELAK